MLKDTYDFCIDPGHGGKDSGATSDGLREADVVLKVAMATTARLYASGYSAVMTRTRDRDLSLRERADWANKMKVRAFVSIHANADPDPDLPGDREACGYEVWHHMDSSQGRILARSLVDALSGALPDELNRGVRETGTLYVLRVTVMPAALVELGFIDRAATRDRMRTDAYLVAVGAAIADGARAWLENVVA